eukprot:2126098-Amphidinium_carterae.1
MAGRLYMVQVTRPKTGWSQHRAETPPVQPPIEVQPLPAAVQSATSSCDGLHCFVDAALAAFNWAILAPSCPGHLFPRRFKRCWPYAPHSLHASSCPTASLRRVDVKQLQAVTLTHSLSELKRNVPPGLLSVWAAPLCALRLSSHIWHMLGTLFR